MLKHCIRRCMVGIVLVSLGISAVYAQDITGGGQNLTNAAQNGNTGKVIGDYGQPLADVVISAQDGKTLDTTKDDGTFNLPEVALGQKLIFICKNFDIRVVVVENTTNMIVKMHDSYLKKEANPELLYSRKNQKDAVGSNASVYTRQLQTTPTSLYLNALTGRLAGFYTEETSGFRSALTTGITYHDLAGQLPSSGTKYTSNNTDNTEMNISLRGQTPVTIVDGVQRDIYSLDPENIESITVLKDALSTILLGQKSSRGVLQVITKKGVAGPPRISFTVESGVQSRLKTPTPLSSYQYAYLYNEALQNDGKIRAYSDVDFYGFRSGSSPYKYPDVNWYNTILKDYAPMTKCNLNVSGGIKNARYSMSVSYLNQQGMFKEASDVNYNTNLSLNRYLINSSVDIDVTKNFTVGLQLFGRIQDGNQPGAGTSTVLSKLYTTPNNAYPVLNPDGSYGGSSDYTVNLYQQTTGSGYLLDNSRDLMANLDLKYKFNQWLPGLYASVKVNTSSTSSSLISRSIVKPVYDVSIADDGTVSYTRYG
ncbi:MAG TPA: TonB-dependent receptor plug domain-containing protein, partial [Bacteroidales bacterium]